MSMYFELLHRPSNKFLNREKSNKRSLQNILEFLHVDNKRKYFKPKGKLIKGSSKTNLNRSEVNESMQNPFNYEQICINELKSEKKGRNMTPSFDLPKSYPKQPSLASLPFKHQNIPQDKIMPVKSLRILKRLINEHSKIYNESIEIYDKSDCISVNRKNIIPKYKKSHSRVEKILENLKTRSKVLKKTEEKTKNLDLYTIAGWEIPPDQD